MISMACKLADPCDTNGHSANQRLLRVVEVLGHMLA
jgi:hypothetical protein